MTTQFDPTASLPLSHRERGWLLVLLVPPVLVMSSIVLAVILSLKISLNAERDVSAALAANLQNVIDQETMYDNSTSAERSVDWQRLSQAIRGLETRFSGLLRHDKNAAASQIDPSTLERYSLEAQPLIARLKELIGDQTPIWNPNVLISWMDLKASVPFVDLLEIEFHAALSAGDHGRALQTLQLLVEIAPILDYSAAIQFYFWHATTSETHRRLIAESLQVGFWTEPQQLTELLDQLAEFQRLSIDQAGLPEPWDNLSLKADLSSEQRIETFNEGASKRSLTDKFLSVTGGMGDYPQFLSNDEAIQQLEMDNRMTRTAIAIKRFQLQENRWPSQLSDLQIVDVSSEDSMASPGTPLGFHVDQKDHLARVWLPFAEDGQPIVTPLLIPTRVFRWDSYRRHISYYRSIVIR